MNRREWLQLSLAASLSLTASSCGFKRSQPVRIAAHMWPGYEFLYLARSLDVMDPALVRLVETPNATANIRALGSNVVEGACLTLDEALTALERGIRLSVVCVLDVSMGADALLVPANVESLAGIKGLRIGVEHTATGAVMLDASLKAAGLSPDDIEIVYLSIDEHIQSYHNGLVEALVTYEPVKNQLIKAGMKSVFTSGEIPGNIIDVITVRTDVLNQQREGIREAVQGHFRALERWQADPEKYASYLAKRLNVPDAEITGLFSDLELPDRMANRRWLGGTQPEIMEMARHLGETMLASGLLHTMPDISLLANDSFLD